MTFAQWRNRLTTHYSERIPIVKRRISVYDKTHFTVVHSLVCYINLNTVKLLVSDQLHTTSRRLAGMKTHNSTQSYIWYHLNKFLKHRSLFNTSVESPHLLDFRLISLRAGVYAVGYRNMPTAGARWTRIVKSLYWLSYTSSTIVTKETSSVPVLRDAWTANKKDIFSFCSHLMINTSLLDRPNR